jgi:hypothetical protein
MLRASARLLDSPLRPHGCASLPHDLRRRYHRVRKTAAAAFNRCDAALQMSAIPPKN